VKACIYPVFLNSGLLKVRQLTVTYWSIRSSWDESEVWVQQQRPVQFMAFPWTPGCKLCFTPLVFCFPESKRSVFTYFI